MPKKILIIDDEPDLLKLTAMRLESAGYEILTAANGGEAYRILAAHVPDLILLDVVMPGIDGYEVCNDIKSDDRTRRVPVILFTAKPEQKTRLKSNSEFIAADDYIMKPFDDAELLNKIKKFIG